MGEEPRALVRDAARCSGSFGDVWDDLLVDSPQPDAGDYMVEAIRLDTAARNSSVNLASARNTPRGIRIVEKLLITCAKAVEKLSYEVCFREDASTLCVLGRVDTAFVSRFA